jgi:hypothetical protein
MFGVVGVRHWPTRRPAPGEHDADRHQPNPSLLSELYTNVVGSRGGEFAKSAAARIRLRADIAKSAYGPAAPERRLSPKSLARFLASAFARAMRGRQSRRLHSAPFHSREWIVRRSSAKGERKAVAPVECPASGASQLALDAWRWSGAIARADERRPGARSPSVARRRRSLSIPYAASPKSISIAY